MGRIEHFHVHSCCGDLCNGSDDLHRHDVTWCLMDVFTRLSLHNNRQSPEWAPAWHINWVNWHGSLLNSIYNTSMMQQNLSDGSVVGMDTDYSYRATLTV